MNWALIGGWHACRAASSRESIRSKFHPDMRIYRVVDLAQRWKKFDENEECRKTEEERD